MIPAVVAVIGALYLSGCSSSNGGTSESNAMPSRTTSGSQQAGTSSAVPAAQFDPCTALTTSFLAAHAWDALPPAPRHESSGGMQWQGCRFVAKASYGFEVQTTNGSLKQIRQKFPAAADLTIGGRNALRYEAQPDNPGGCTVNVEMANGSLYILVDDPDSYAGKAPCETATDIATAVVPLIPAGA
ncbi:DUF3558 domain-containing protein [Nocardia stercoris]|uniref:DUF3558 domain-containing protein n=2 Tax=Nocardia stercoris TaxID=2483361 RepID=A0A3M2L2A3_9NOCA|nr:DUF3558 domain-containing protein [Nocardia stercoris]